jgi:hypothetical protein
MRSALLVASAALVFAIVACGPDDVAVRPDARAPVAARQLRVCADPNNLPFSNERGEGFAGAA